MTDTKISALTELTSPATTDYVPINDDETTDVTKKITLANLLKVVGSLTELAVAADGTDEFLVLDAGVPKRIDASLVGGGAAFDIRKYGTWPYAGGYWDQTTLDTITESALSPNPGNWSSLTNLHDGNTGTQAVYSTGLTSYPRVKCDMGEIVGLDRFRIYQNHGTDYISSVWIYGSTTGSFGGEEVEVATRTGLVSSSSWQECDFTTYGSGPAAYRYWAVKGWRNAAGNWWRPNEFGWRWQPQVVFANVPFGVKIEGYDSSDVLQETQQRTSYPQGNSILSFTTTGLDRYKFYDPAGTLFFDTDDGSYTFSAGDTWTCWAWS